MYTLNSVGDFSAAVLGEAEACLQSEADRISGLGRAIVDFLGHLDSFPLEHSLSLICSLLATGQVNCPDDRKDRGEPHEQYLFLLFDETDAVARK